jgi:tetratricopeptide (TPR) repeat protein
MREYDKALADLEEALQLDPEHASAWVMRAVVWICKEEYKKAIDDANKAVEFAPENAFAYCVRGRARFFCHRDYGEAIEECRKAMQLDSEEGAAYRVLAQIQATCPDERFRDGANAILNAEQAKRLVGSNQGVVSTLAAAYAEDGQFDKAAEWQRRAIELLAEDEYATDREEEELRSRLLLYTQGKPYREQRGSP